MYSPTTPSQVYFPCPLSPLLTSSSCSCIRCVHATCMATWLYTSVSLSGLTIHAPHSPIKQVPLVWNRTGWPHASKWLWIVFFTFLKADPIRTHSLALTRYIIYSSHEEGNNENRAHSVNHAPIQFRTGAGSSRFYLGTRPWGRTSGPNRAAELHNLT